MKFPLISLFLCFIISVAIARQDSNVRPFPQPEQLTFYLLDVEAGLSHNYINSIEQDSLGFIWIATLEGLNRFDGRNFVTYRKNNRIRSAGPLDNYIQHIALNDQCQLLLSTNAGLSIYDPKTDQFRHRNKNFGLLQDNASHTAIGPDSTIAVAIYGGGVQLINQQEVFHTFTYSPDQSNSLSSEKISSVAFQGDSVLWVGSFDSGLDKINYQQKTVQQLSDQPSITKQVNCLYVDDLGNLWIGANNGVQVITAQGDTLHIPHASRPEKGLSDASVLCFEKGPNGNIWAGTRNGGLNIIHVQSLLKEGNIHAQWFLPKTDGSSVFNRTVSSLKLAKDGNMWIGTSTGVNVVNPMGDPIQLIQRNLSHEHTIAHDRIGSLAEGKNGTIWIGTDGGGLDWYRPRSGSIIHYTHQPGNPHTLSNNYIISLLEDSKGRIWAGTYQSGLNLLDPQSGKCKHYLQGSQEDGNDVRVIFEDKKGQIWVGTNRGGLYRYHPPIDNFDYVKQLGKIDIRDIAEDERGNLWIATFGDGIIRYNYLTGEKEVFDESTVFGFPSGIIFSITLLDNGDVLAGARHEGLIRLDPINKTVAVFTQENGLSNNTVNSMVRGQDGKIWLGTFNGISYFDPATNKAGKLNGYNNIQRSEFNIGAALTHQGKIYLGGNKGINIFDPETLQQESSNYPLVFTDLRLMNKKVNVDDLVRSGTKGSNIPYLKRLHLKYNQSLFSLDFVALKYPTANDISYAYKLEPYHEHWIETQQAGTANLSNIPPGDYTLKIRAQSSPNNYSENQMAVVISPPFWKTWPAYLLYFMVVAGLIVAGMKYYSDRLKLKNSLLFEKKQRQLEHELNEERVQFFTGFSHELKTPLTLIMAPVEDLLLESENTRHIKGLKLVLKNARYLMEMINKLLEFRKTELDVHQLHLENHAIVKPVKQWLEQYQPLARHKSIRLQGKFPKKSFMAAVDLEKLHIIVNNLLSNALKYCRPKDQVTFSLAEKTGQFEIKVKDTGPGIVKADQEKIFQWYYQSVSSPRQKGAGIGLALTKRLVKDHQGTISLQSQPGQGCEFTVILPKYQMDTSLPLESEMARQVSWAPEEITEEIAVPKSTFHLKEAKEVILLIDDNPEILSYLDNLLHDNYDLIYAQNGQEGLEKAVQYIPDIILSDIMMPKKNGIDLCGMLKRQRATTHIPLILLSAKDNVESITSGYGEGADDYITKPFNGQILKSRIENLLATKIRLRDYYLGKKDRDQKLTEGQKKAISKEKAFLKALEEHILQQLGEQNSDVETICQLMGMSRTSLFRKLKALTGQNINQYTRTVKINRAAYLIREEHLGIAQAAYEVGFSSPKYFRKLFKEQFGYLPSALDKKIGLE